MSGVDATHIDPNLGGPPARFRYIVFNYPMVIVPRPEMVETNRRLIMRFLASAAPALAPGGKIYLSSKEYWLARWKLPEAAAAAGLRCETDIDRNVQALEFDAAAFPGYEHRETHADTTAKDAGNGLTVVFSKG